MYNDLKLTSVQWGAGGAATPGAHQWGVKIDTKTNTTLFHCKTLTSYRFGLEYTPDGGRNNWLKDLFQLFTAPDIHQRMQRWLGWDVQIDFSCGRPPLSARHRMETQILDLYITAIGVKQFFLAETPVDLLKSEENCNRSSI